MIFINTQIQKLPDVKLKFEKGMFDEAANKGKSFTAWLEDYFEEKGIEPTIYKGMSKFEMIKYRRQLVKSNQPIPKNAFEMALEMSGIRAYGDKTDLVGKFFEVTSNSILFLEFVANTIFAGSIRNALYPDFVANMVSIDALDYKSIYLEDTEGDRRTSRVNRDEDIPIKRVKAGKQNVSLDKYAIGIEFDYEVYYLSPLNLYGMTLDRIGRQIGVDETNDLIYILQNGDGNGNGLKAANTDTTVTSGSIEKKDIIKLASVLPSGYELDVFVGRKAYMQEFWDTLSNMQNPSAQWGMTGMKLPVGKDWDEDVVTADRFIGVDSSSTVSYITNDTMNMTEMDKIITKQKVLSTVSKRSHFNINDSDGIGCLDIEH